MTGGFPDRVHGQLRHADIDRGHTDLGGGQWADCGTASQIVTHHELLTGNTGLFAEEAEQPGGEAIGGVPLVGV